VVESIVLVDGDSGARIDLKERSQHRIAISSGRLGGGKECSFAHFVFVWYGWNAGQGPRLTYLLFRRVTPSQPGDSDLQGSARERVDADKQQKSEAAWYCWRGGSRRVEKRKACVSE